MKSKTVAYFLWLISIFGWLGFHHFYLGKILKGLIWIFTGGVFGIGSLVDLFTLGGAVDNYNTKQELNTIRTASLSTIANQKKEAAREAQVTKDAVVQNEVQSVQSSDLKQSETSKPQNTPSSGDIPKYIVPSIVGIGAILVVVILLYEVVIPKISEFTEPESPIQDNGIVTVEFLNDVSGYHFTVTWKPTRVRYKHVLGPAIIEMSKEGEDTHILLNENFGLLKERLPFTYDENGYELIELNEDFIVLDYDVNVPISKDGFGTTDEPFFFMDVNFDNQNELLMAEVDNGQRGVATFKVYMITDYGEIYNASNLEPYRSLDEMSSIRYSERIINIHGSGGACAGSDYVYTFVPPINEYQVDTYILDRIFEEESEGEWDDEERTCYVFEYAVNTPPQTKTLIAKRKREN